MTHTTGQMVSVETRLYLPAEPIGTAGGVDFKHAPSGAADAKRAAKCWNTHDGLVEALRLIARTSRDAGEIAANALLAAGEEIER